jgi:hypothetical protein
MVSKAYKSGPSLGTVNIKNLWKKQQFEICGKNNTLKFVEKTTI